MATWKASLLRPGALYDRINTVRSPDIEIDLGAVRGYTGLVTTATLADAVWAWVVANTNAFLLSTNSADDGTKTATGMFQFQLPQDWQNGQTITVNIRCQLDSTAGTGVANNGSSIDVECYEQTDDAVSADLCATAAATFAALDTFYTKSFVLNTGGLVAGDKISIKVVGSAIENDAGNGTLRVQIAKISLSVSTPS